MVNREKVFDALRNCVTEPKFFPWEDQERVKRQCVKVPIALLLDTLNVLKEQSEQKHGHWILYENQRREEVENGNFYYICSQCSKGDVHAKTQDVPYCWWCGAKMDEEVNQDE